ncbi:MAG: sigma-70 family RNA polymerase sigma factor [Bryobacteraceae bacterium]
MTELLVAWSHGEQGALDRLVPLIYSELHRLARRYVHQQGPGLTLQTTALVNEAYLRLVNQQQVNWQDRAHFFAVAATSMRHILVDMARGRGRQRRGGGAPVVPLDEALVFSPERSSEMLALDDALTALAKLDERKARIVELRFFGGLSLEETGEVLKISHATVEREWARARAWLSVELRPSSSNPGGS